MKCISKEVAISSINLSVYSYHSVFNNQNYESVKQQKILLKDSKNYSLKLNVSMKTHF